MVRSTSWSSYSLNKVLFGGYVQGLKGGLTPALPRVSLTFGLAHQVEFPEARIYEETLNILLYESQDGRGPDNALLEATGGAAGRSHHLDEDEERDRIERVRRIHIKRPDDRTHHHQ